MTDTPDPADADREPDAHRPDIDQRNSPGSTDRDGKLSRRGILAGLGGLGLAGLGAAAAGASGPSARGRQGDLVRSRNAWTLEIDGDRALRLEPTRRLEREDGDVTGGGNVLFGHVNVIADGVAGAAIGGGGLFDHEDRQAEPNRIHGHFGTIAGGFGNDAGVEDDTDEGTAAAIGGGVHNLASGTGATIAGGARNEATGLRSAVGGGINNEAEGVEATVGGGIGNYANGRFAAVAGGGGNSATAAYTTVGGGRGNHATEESGTVAGGYKNSARARRATVGGGYYNKAHGYAAVVPGGKDNVADGKYSFAMGYHAETAGHEGAVVFADSSERPMEADADDAAFFQMPIHAPAFNSTSSRTTKTAFGPVDPESVLDSVLDLDVRTWRFEDGDGARHLGPTAEDFHDAFELGADEASIATVDADGVALAAIQGLAGRLERATDRIGELEGERDARDGRIDELEAKRDARDERVDALEAALDAKDDRIEALESRLAALESAIAEPADEDDGATATAGASTQASP